MVRSARRRCFSGDEIDDSDLFVRHRGTGTIPTTVLLTVARTIIWSIGPEESDTFAPSSARSMINYRVEDLHALVKVLKEESCNVFEKTDESEYGKFAWVIDPEGNKVELWQPPEGQ